MNTPRPPSAIELVPVRRRHVPAIQSMAGDAGVAVFAGLPHPYPPDGARTFVALAEQARGQGTEYHLAILHGGRCVGVCGVKRIDPTRRSGEIGYWLGRAQWGRGIATAAVAELCRIARTELGLRSLSAWSLETNARSVRVLEKSGFAPSRREPNGQRLPHCDPGAYLLFFERALP